MTILGFDLHGVIDSNPENFKRVLAKLISNKFKIYIISGPSEKKLMKELLALGFLEGTHFHKIFSIVDYLKSKNTEMWLDDKNTWWSSDEEWWSSKAKICKEHKVDLLLDDTIQYQRFLGKGNIADKTTFVLYDSELKRIAKKHEWNWPWW